MHPYIPYLLSDIAAAHRTGPAEPAYPKTIEEHLEEVERWIEGEEPAHTFGYYCGLEAVNFPPPYQLTDAEMKQVIKAFGQMMFSWNLSLDLPEALPLPNAYKMTVDTLDTKTEIVNNGMIGFDFCTGYAPDCVFKEYCPCREFWDSEETDPPPQTPDELPF